MTGKGRAVRNALAGAVLVAFFGGFAPLMTGATNDESPAPTDTASASATATPTPVASAAPSSAASAADSASPVPQVDDTSAEARAKEWLARLQKGQLDRTQLTSDLSAGLQEATVQALAKQLSPLGTPQKIVLEKKQQVAGITTWIFLVSWPDQVLDYTFGVENGTGKISALYLRPGRPA